MIELEGKLVARNGLDVIAVAEERCPGCRLLGVQTTLVVRDAGGVVRVVTATKEKRK